MKAPLVAQNCQMRPPLFPHSRENMAYPVRDKILVEKKKHHKNRHAVGMPHRHIMLHTYGMLCALEMTILPISHPYGMNRAQSIIREIIIRENSCYVIPVKTGTWQQNQIRENSCNSRTQNHSIHLIK
jgi:hypothetical protein